LAEISKIFSETNELTEHKLQVKDHWNVLYQFSAFYADRKSKMATTAAHRLHCTLWENVQKPSSQKLQI
jgi:hypothetical protein